jgi:hypothetical protein
VDAQDSLYPHNASEIKEEEEEEEKEEEEEEEEEDCD